jgi:ATP-dependent Clp protease ATP-binding subunit ClpC
MPRRRGRANSDDDAGHRRQHVTDQCAGGGIERDEQFARFTARAREVFTAAQDEAQRFNHNYIGTEHILLGLARIEDGLAARVLAERGITAPKVRAAVEHIIGRGESQHAGPFGLTPRAKRVIELAADEAKRLKHRYIGTEHLLLGLMREGEGIAAGVLESLGVNLEKASELVMRTLADAAGPADRTDTAASSNVVTCRVDARDLVAIDTLVEAAVRSTRSDAAAWLIHAGIEANAVLLDSLTETVSEIRRLRGVARALANDVLANEGSGVRGQGPGDADRPAADA